MGVNDKPNNAWHYNIRVRITKYVFFFFCTKSVILTSVCKYVGHARTSCRPGAGGTRKLTERATGAAARPEVKRARDSTHRRSTASAPAANAAANWQKPPPPQVSSRRTQRRRRLRLRRRRRAGIRTARTDRTRTRFATPSRHRRDRNPPETRAKTARQRDVGTMSVRVGGAREDSSRARKFQVSPNYDIYIYIYILIRAKYVDWKKNLRFRGDNTRVNQIYDFFTPFRRF